MTALTEFLELNKDDGRIFSHFRNGYMNGEMNGGKIRRISDVKIEKICTKLGITTEAFKSTEEKDGLFAQSTSVLRLLQHEVIYQINKKDGVVEEAEEAKHERALEKLKGELRKDYQKMSASVYPEDDYGRVLYYIRHEETPDIPGAMRENKTVTRIWNMLTATKPKAFWQILEQAEYNPEQLYKLACNLESESILLKARWMLETNRRLEYKREAVTKKDAKELEENC